MSQQRSAAEHHEGQRGRDSDRIIADRGPERGDGPAHVEYFGHLGHAAGWVNSVPCVAAGDQIEGTSAGVPGFEVSDLDVDAVGAGNLGHPLVHLDTKDGQAALCPAAQRPCRCHFRRRALPQAASRQGRRSGRPGRTRGNGRTAPPPHRRIPRAPGRGEVHRKSSARDNATDHARSPGSGNSSPGGALEPTDPGGTIGRPVQKHANL
jgi:hypothetical protein